jgi:hypothetical protein
MLEGTALSSAKDHATQRHKPRYPFTPSQHAEALHPVKAKGQVFIARKLPPAGKWTTDPDPYHPWELDMVLYGIAGDRDIYATMNRFTTCQSWQDVPQRPCSSWCWSDFGARVCRSPPWPSAADRGYT